MARNWGIMGTGGIAAALADAIVAEGDHVVAVSSAAADRADAFAAQRGITRSYGSHHELVSDPDVEVVYVATTNDRHHLDVQACIDAGLPVLVPQLAPGQPAPWRRGGRDRRAAGAQEGYRHEVREVRRCFDAGLTESDRLPLDLTLEVMAALDQAREQLGVSFPEPVGS